MGQSLTAIKAMSVALKQPNSQVTDIAGNIIDICNHLSTVVRSMMRSLHPLSLTELGLGLTLKDMIDEWLRRHPVLAIQLDYDEGLESVKDELTIHIYRIIQECLTNVVRHADAENVTINLKKRKENEQEYAFVSVSDDGKGSSAEGEGFGVRSMRERVESMHGEFSYTFLPGKGVTVIATMPLN
jgi:two-component system sensor histidine kinase UhpB